MSNPLIKTVTVTVDGGFLFPNVNEAALKSTAVRLNLVEARVTGVEITLGKNGQPDVCKFQMSAQQAEITYVV